MAKLSPQSKARKMQWQRDQRARYATEHGYSSAANYATGGNRAAVLARDGHACVKCGMSDAAHKIKWGRPITIDHKSKDRSDNSMGNLQTLCLACHGNKDLLPRLRERKAEPFAPEMKRLRAAGHTYQSIADAVGVSIATVWKYIGESQ